MGGSRHIRILWLPKFVGPLICSATSPRRPKRWTEADIDPLAEKQIAIIVERLYSLRPTDDDDGNPHPVVVKLTRDAKGVWKKYFNAHAVEQVNLTGELSAA